jgi:hypothetical protein
MEFLSPIAAALLDKGMLRGCTNEEIALLDLNQANPVACSIR